MRFHYYSPSEVLAPYIRQYWVLEAGASEAPVTERVVPNAHIELMFHYGNPFDISTAGHRSSQPRSLISGLSHTFSDVVTRGESGVIAVAFHPYGACNFFPFSLRELENLSIGLEDIDRSEIRDVEDRLGRARTLPERIVIVERYLAGRLKPIDPLDMKRLREGLRLIRESRGQIRVPELAEALCLSGKTLERKFAAYLGKAPKQYLRIVRFVESMHSLQRPGKENLTRIALGNGYFDQAHFINDFKALSGLTPSEFAAYCPEGAENAR